MDGNDPNPNLTVSPASVSETVDVQDAGTPPPKGRGALIPALIGLALAGGLGWILFNRLILPLMMGGQGQALPPTPVQLDRPNSSTVQSTSDYVATLDSRQSVKVQPQVSGRIVEIYVQAGDRVEAGEPLLQLDSSTQRAQVASRAAAADTAAAEIDTAQANVDNAVRSLGSLEARRASAQADLEFKQGEYRRFQQLVKEGATSQQNADQRLNDLRAAEAALREAEADIQAQQSSIAAARSSVARNERAYQQAQANISESASQLDDYTLVAPFAGIVGSIPVKIGDTVNSSTPLLTVTQNDRLEIQVQVPLERAGQLRAGLPVELLDEQNKVLQRGRISFISPDVDPATQSILTKATFDNSSNLRTAQFTRARIIWNQNPGVLVPTSAISRLAGKNFIFVAMAAKDASCDKAAQPGAPTPPPDQLVAAQQPIELGKIIGNDQEVLEGLKGSDRIITTGILQLQNCAPIVDAAQMPQSPGR